MKLKIFSDQSYLPEGIGHVAMLYPFWGKNPEDDKDLQSGRYDHYAEIGHSFFEMTSLSEADIAVLPTPWKFVRDNEIAHNLAIQFEEKATQAGKKLLCFLQAIGLKKYRSKTLSSSAHPFFVLKGNLTNLQCLPGAKTSWRNTSTVSLLYDRSKPNRL
jgi:hypothetical protein